MTQRSFVFPNVVSDHDGIRRKNPNQFCFQILCRITSRSDTQIVNSKCVSKFCVGSHQHPTQKKQSLLCCQILCRIPSTSDTKKQSRLCFQVLCRIPSTSDTKIKACCVSKFHVGSKFCVGSHQHPTQKKQSRWCFHVLNRIPSASDTKMKVTKL